MNEETNTPEPLSAILAEMRDGIHTGRADIIDCVNDRLRSYADRIEEAAERERASLEDALSHCREYATKIERENEEGETRLDAEEIIATVDNEFAGIRPASAPGNAAEMRDLLEKIRHEYGWGRISCRTCVSSEADVERVSDLFEKQIDAALAAPARNCDRFATPDEAMRAFAVATGTTTIDMDAALSFAAWLFAPADGGMSFYEFRKEGGAK